MHRFHLAFLFTAALASPAAGQTPTLRTLPVDFPEVGAGALPLSSDSFVTAIGGPVLPDLETEGSCTEAPDWEAESILVASFGEAAPALVPLPPPPWPLLRLSATRVLAISPPTYALPDPREVRVLDDIGGGGNLMGPALPVGWIAADVHGGDAWARLRDDVAVLVSKGAGFDEDDDEVVVVSATEGTARTFPAPGSSCCPLILGATRFVVPRSGGFYAFRVDADGDVDQRSVDAPSSPQLVLTPTRALGWSQGPDGRFPSADDELHLFTDLAGAPQRVDLAAPYTSPTELVRLADDRALLGSSGPDGAFGTADDGLFRFAGSGGDASLTWIPVPNLKTDGHGGFFAAPPLALDRDLAAVLVRGGAGPGAHAADAIALLSDLGAGDTVTPLPVGPVAAGYGGQPRRSGPRSLAVASVGPDLALASADDEIVVVAHLGGTPSLERVVVGDLASSPVVPFGGGVLAASGGADGLHGTDDDVLVVVTGSGADLEVTSLPAPHLVGPFSASFGATLLGNGRAVLSLPYSELSCLSAFYLIDGLPGDLRLAARQISIEPDRERGARIRASAELSLPEPERFARADLAVRVGNAAQVIPAEAFEATASGFRYRDPRGRRGFLRLVEYDAAARTLVIKGRGKGTGAASTPPERIVLSIESVDWFAAQSLSGVRLRGGGIRYRAR